MEPSAPICLPRPVDRQCCIEHWVVDAGCGRELVDDVAHALARIGGAR